MFPWVTDILGKSVAKVGAIVNPRRGILNFSADFNVDDNPITGSTDVSLANPGGGGGGGPGDIEGVTAGDGLTGGGTTGTVSLAVQAANSTISVSGSGVRVGQIGDANVAAAAAIAGSKIAPDFGAQNPCTLGSFRAGATSSSGEADGSFVSISTSSTPTRNFVAFQYSTDTEGTRFIGFKARGTRTSPTAVGSGDAISWWIASGYDGIAFYEAGQMRWVVDGGVTSGIVPIGLEIRTGSTASPTKRFGISSGGTINTPGLTSGLLRCDGSGNWSSLSGSVVGDVAYWDGTSWQAGTAPATYSGSFTTTTATTTTVQSIPLSDDRTYSIGLKVIARDTTTNFGKWKDSFEFERASGNAPVEIGTSDGPAPPPTAIGSLSTGWVTATVSSNNLVISVVTGTTAHTKFDYEIWVTSRAVTAAV